MSEILNSPTMQYSDMLARIYAYACAGAVLSAAMLAVLARGVAGAAGAA